MDKHVGEELPDIAAEYKKGLHGQVVVSTRAVVEPALCQCIGRGKNIFRENKDKDIEADNLEGKSIIGILETSVQDAVLHIS